MNLNLKIYCKYILFNFNQIFLKYKYKTIQNTSVFLSANSCYYLIFHFKFSSLFYSTQLIEIFSYDLPISSNKNFLNDNLPINIHIIKTLVVFNFHLINLQQRIFLFVFNNKTKNFNTNSNNNTTLTSITELFSNANWLERESSELNNIFFLGKKDLRNLMLQYGDTSAPFQKIFPSIGVKEIFYDSITDLLIQNPVSIQF